VLDGGAQAAFFNAYPASSLRLPLCYPDVACALAHAKHYLAAG
jgi:hypothetical protein